MFWTFQKKFLVAHGDTIWQLPNLVATQRSALRNQIRADQNRIIQKKIKIELTMQRCWDIKAWQKNYDIVGRYMALERRRRQTSQLLLGSKPDHHAGRV
jgi:hypothetical protein